MKHTFSVISDLLQLFWSFFILMHNATLIMSSMLLKKDWNNLKSVIDLYYLGYLNFCVEIFMLLQIKVTLHVVSKTKVTKVNFSELSTI